MKIKKYELTDETLSWNGHTLHRIKALRSFGDVEVGELGGWIENEDNLSQDDDCWVSDEAKVFGNAKVSDNATVSDYAEVYGKAKVYHNAVVKDNAKVYGRAVVYGWGWVCDNAKVGGHAKVYGHADIRGYAWVFGDAQVYGDALLSDNAKVGGNAHVFGEAVLSGDAVIKETKDYAVFKNTWSSGRYFTWTRSNDKWSVGCFYGTGKQLIKKAYADGELKGKCYEAVVQMQNRISELLK